MYTHRKEKTVQCSYMYKWIKRKFISYQGSMCLKIISFPDRTSQKYLEGLPELQGQRESQQGYFSVLERKMMIKVQIRKEKKKKLFNFSK